MNKEEAGGIRIWSLAVKDQNLYQLQPESTWGAREETARYSLIWGGKIYRLGYPNGVPPNGIFPLTKLPHSVVASE